MGGGANSDTFSLDGSRIRKEKLIRNGEGKSFIFVKTTRKGLEKLEIFIRNRQDIK